MEITEGMGKFLTTYVLKISTLYLCNFISTLTFCLYFYRGYGTGYYQRPRTGWGWGGNAGYARSTSGFGGFSSGGGGGSSGTRTASGFGGTRRR